MNTDSNRLIDQVQELLLELTTPTTRVVLVGPHILYIDSSTGQVLNLRRPKVLNNLLRTLNLMPVDEQITEAMHCTFVGIIEGEGEYLEMTLQQRDMLDEYRKLLAVISSKRNTGNLILQLVGKHGIYVLSPEGEPVVELQDWTLELPIDLDNQWDTFELFEPRVP